MSAVYCAVRLVNVLIMRISNNEIEFEDSGWTVSSTSDNRIKVEHNNGEVYYFNDVGELEASSIDVKSVNTDTLNNTPATVTWADSGELVLLDTHRFTIESVGIFDPDFTVVYGGPRSAQLPYATLDNLSNVNIKLSFTVDVQSTGDPSEVTLYRGGSALTDSILSLNAGETGRFHSPLADLPSLSDSDKYDLFARCGSNTDNQIIIDTASLNVWGEIQ